MKEAIYAPTSGKRRQSTYISLFTLSGGRHRMFSAYNAHKNSIGRPEVTKVTIESVGDEYATL